MSYDLKKFVDQGCKLHDIAKDAVDVGKRDLATFFNFHLIDLGMYQ